MEACLFHLLVVVVVVVRRKWRANYRTNCFEIFNEGSPARSYLDLVTVFFLGGGTMYARDGATRDSLE